MVCGQDMKAGDGGGGGGELLSSIHSSTNRTKRTLTVDCWMLHGPRCVILMLLFLFKLSQPGRTGVCHSPRQEARRAL